METKTIKENWFMQSAEKLSTRGEKISSIDFPTDGWYPVAVPTTVISGLVQNNVYPDPYIGTNMKTIPGYKICKNEIFSNVDKPDDSPFKKPWWFRNEFTINKNSQNERIWLLFKGINYGAEIWLNGQQISKADNTKGTFRQYDFDVTQYLNPNRKNVLALEVFSPQSNDLGLTFIDWSPSPPDDSMGIWQPVYLRTTGPVFIKNTFVQSKLNTETLKEAELLINSELHNPTEKSISGTIEGKIEDIFFSQDIKLNPFQNKTCVFSTKKFPRLRINNPRLWWPYQLGIPELYKLSLNLKINGLVTDQAEITFGIRDIQSRINKHGSRLFTINGEDILIRGAAWAPDLLLRQSAFQDEMDIKFLKNLNMNTFRLEGKLATDYFWDLCDREGILVLAGWPCCNHWEKWENWKEGDLEIAKESLRSQLLRLRNHPSFTAWLYGSDFPPPESVEREYLKILEETTPELPKISNAAAKPSKIQGKTGVKMSGPYSYVPPSYWYTSGMAGMAVGFNTETCPGISIPVPESLKKMLPADQCYVGSESWDYHTGLDPFNNTHPDTQAIKNRYGEPQDIEDYSKNAQLLSYECWRAMYEAHARNFPRATGVIGWMLNSSWPSLIWQLYDFYLNPTGGFYGSKKACEPLHVQYSYDDSSIWVVNTTMKKFEKLQVDATVFNMNLEKKFKRSETVNLSPCSSIEIFKIPEIKNLSTVYFLSLIIKNETQVIDNNFYWLSIKPDIFEEKGCWYTHPLKSHANMSAIRTLPRSAVESSFQIADTSENVKVILNCRNSSNTIAFFLWAKIINKTTKELIAPVFWNDNCISLLPSENNEWIATIPKWAINGKIGVKIDGWNL